MLSAKNVLRRHQWICGQKDGQALLQDTKPQTGGSLVKRRSKAVAKGASEGALHRNLRVPGAGGGSAGKGGRPPGAPSTSPWFHLAAPSASAMVLGHWFPMSGWDNPHALRATVWPPVNFGANPPFKPFLVKARVGHHDLKYCFGHCLCTSFLNFGTLSCLCCWGTCCFFRDGAGSLVIVTLIGDKVQSKN